MTMTTLEAVCESIRYGYTESANIEPIGPHFLRITDIVPSSIDWATVPYCTINDTEREKYALRPGDIVVARTGATVGYAKLIRNPVNAVFASYLVRFRVDRDKAEPGYVGRIVESVTYKEFVWSRINGAAQPNASAPVLGAFPFRLPSRDKQKRIVESLSNYDDLIATNQRRIALLEDAARRLYREWFVHLRFPGHDSVAVKDGVPEGWRRDTLDKALFLQRGFDLPNGARVCGEVPVYASTGINGFHNEARANGPGVVTGRSGTLGVVHYVPKDYWPLNTSLWVKEFRSVSPLLAYFMLSELQLEQFNSGASVPTLDRKVVHQIPVLIPARDVNKQFDSLAQSLFDQIHTLHSSNEVATRARDLLLPKLMSGQLDVSGITLPEAIAA